MVDKKKILTIIIPVFNIERYLTRCLNSVLVVESDDLQIILVNDGSTDGSGQICDDFAKQDSRITVVHKTNGGVSSARNMGLTFSQGQWIMFVDADDWLSDDFLDLLMPRLVAGIADTDLFQYNVNREGNIPRLSTKKLNSILEYCNCNYFQPAVWNYIYKASILQNHNLIFMEGLKYAEDFAFILSYFSHISSIQCLEDVIYTYFIRPDSAMGEIKYIDFTNNNILAIQSILSNLNVPNRDKYFFTKCIYGLLRYTIFQIVKSDCDDNFIRSFNSTYRRLFKELFFYDRNILKYPLLLVSYLSFNLTQKILRIVWL